MPSSNKKVILRTVEDDVHAGYLPASGFVSIASGQPTVPLLELAGRIREFPLGCLRWIAWVQDFDLDKKENPEQLDRRTFLARPRREGLWVRVQLRAGDSMEGLAALDLALLDAMLEDEGMFLTPPDTRSNTKRLFFPRTAMIGLE